MRTLESYSQQIQVYKILFLTLIPIPYIRSLEFAHFIAEYLVCLTNIPPFPHPLDSVIFFPLLFKKIFIFIA